jgi:citrate/tricarballylate utilization protein
MGTMDELFAAAERQLNICNSCRYCEGYCAVFPALERRTVLETGDITHLANLCHDCRACFYACMYAPPHEFGVNPPEILAEVRRATYDAYPRPPRLPARLRTRSVLGGQSVLGERSALAAAALGVAAALLVLIALTEGIDAVTRHGGPYQVISYPALLVTVLLPCAWSVAVILRAMARYWHDTHGRLRDLADWPALSRALLYALRLRYLRGGGGDCYYPGDNPSPVRRRLHAAVFYGFGACFAATLAAAWMQDVLGVAPPYPLLSVPVVLGTAGGLGMIVGCGGLTVLKRRSDPAPGAGDFGLLLGLGLLALTGLLTLLLRATPAYGLILVAHLATVVVCFGIAPYTKFVHFVYRFLAIVADNLEQARGDGG